MRTLEADLTIPRAGAPPVASASRRRRAIRPEAAARERRTGRGVPGSRSQVRFSARARRGDAWHPDGVGGCAARRGYGSGDRAAAGVARSARTRSRPIVHAAPSRSPRDRPKRPRAGRAALLGRCTARRGRSHTRPGRRDARRATHATRCRRMSLELLELAVDGLELKSDRRRDVITVERIQIAGGDHRLPHHVLHRLPHPQVGPEGDDRDELREPDTLAGRGRCHRASFGRPVVAQVADTRSNRPPRNASTNSAWSRRARWP